MAKPLFTAEQAPALGLLHVSCGNKAINDKVTQLRLQGVDWSKIIGALTTVVADIESQNWPAVLAALEQLLPQTP